MASPLLAALEALRRLVARFGARRSGRPEASPAVSTAARPGPSLTLSSPLPEPIGYADLLAWCRRTGKTASFRYGGDRFDVQEAGLRLLLPSGKAMPISPWLAFDRSTGLPSLRPEAIAALAEGSAPLEASFSLDGGPPLAWQALQVELPRGLAGILGDADALLRQGLLDPQVAAGAFEQLRPGESLDAALYRLGLVPFEVWVEGLAGKPLVCGSRGRPLGDRIGMRLLALRAISQGELKAALTAQVQVSSIRPLGQLLGLPSAAIDRALAGQKPELPALPLADAVEEFLIRWGCISRTDWSLALASGGDPLLALVRAGKLSEARRGRALRARQHLVRLYAGHAIRFGQVVVDRGLEPAAIGRALACQADQPLPLAELMVLHRLLPPGEAARALRAQADRYRQQVEAALEPLEAPVEVSPAIPVPAPPIRRRLAPSRRDLAVAAGVCALLAYAIAYGERLHGADYSWFNAFFPGPTPAPAAREHAPSIADRSRTRGTPAPIAVEPIAPLSLAGTSSLRGPGMLARAEPSSLTPIGPDSVAPARLAPQSAPAAVSPPSPSPPATIAVAAVPVAAPPGSMGQPAGPFSVPALRPPVRPGGQVEPRLSASYPPASPLAFSSPSPFLSFGQAMAKLFGRTAPTQAPPGGFAAQRQTFNQQIRPLRTTVERSQAVFNAELGEAYFDQGNLAQAQAAFASAAYSDPTLALPHYYLGAIAARLGQPKLSQSEFGLYLALAPRGEYASQARQALRRP
ncbi:MAG: hypothetical protein KGR26_05500 [Cyanobacteria bacterium REEB65]|nr:hypothetical protein [Cyanobacteria bacterium REEB65]